MREICRRPIRRSTKSGRVLTGIRKGKRSKRLRAPNAGPRCRKGTNTVRSAGRSRSRRCAKHASAPTASASPARRRTRRGIQPPDAPDCRKNTRALRFLNRGKPLYAHGYTSGHRRGRKQYAIPQNKKRTTTEARKPLRPSRVEGMPPSQCIKTMRYPQCKKTRPSSTQEECALPEIGKQRIRPKHKNHIPAQSRKICILSVIKNNTPLPKQSGRARCLRPRQQRIA